MNASIFEKLASELRRLLPGIAVRVHHRPPAVVQSLPGWTPRTPWPKLVGAAPGLHGLALRSDGRWAVEGERVFKRQVDTKQRAWATQTAVEMLKAMGHELPAPLASANRELLLKLDKGGRG